MGDTGKLAVIIDSSVTIPGDERSRQCPGHGYPEHTVSYKEFKSFDSEEELKQWIASQSRFGKRNFEVIVYKPVGVSTRIHLDIPPIT